MFFRDVLGRCNREDASTHDGRSDGALRCVLHLGKRRMIAWRRWREEDEENKKGLLTKNQEGVLLKRSVLQK